MTVLILSSRRNSEFTSSRKEYSIDLQESERSLKQESPLKIIYNDIYGDTYPLKIYTDRVSTHLRINLWNYI